MGTIKEVVYPEGRAPRKMSSKGLAGEVGRKRDPGTSSLLVGDTAGQVTQAGQAIGGRCGPHGSRVS